MKNRETTVTKRRVLAPTQWRTIDLHLHTPASKDFQQPEVTYLDLLHRAEARGLDIIAFTDGDDGYLVVRPISKGR